MSIHWAAVKTTWTAHAKGEAVYSLKHLHPMLIAMDIEVHKSTRQIDLHIGFASHVFTRTAQPDDDPSDIYKDERERRTFDADRYELSLALPELVRNLCKGKAKCYFAKNNNFFVFRSLEQPGVEYRAFFDVGRREKPIRFKLLLTKTMQGSRPVPPT